VRNVLLGAAFILLSAAAVRAQDADANDRVLGVLPNYATVEHGAAPTPVSARWMFAAAAKGTFDPYVYAFTGLTTAIGQGGSTRTYAQRYGTAFADNAIGNMLTSALLPAALRQDPRYYQRGTGSVVGRFAYAASRIAITRGVTGRAEINASELMGNLTAGAVANAYYPAASRSLSATMSRWATQVAWDALANELKEFWPDVRDRLRHR